MSKRININDLQPGMMIEQITQQQGPVKIRKSGLVTSQAMVVGLREMGVVEVAIDEQASFELAQPNTVTQTQRLFIDEQTNQQDAALSEQFNRSLFLPTIQSLPSPIALRIKALQPFVLIATAALMLGLGAAKLEQRLLTVAQSEVKHQEPETVTASPATSNVNEPSKEPPLPAREPALASTPQTPAESVTVSPELLEKFTQAIEAVDEQQSEAPTQLVNVIENEIPRIDQLPASIMLSLPSMQFAAHMYASSFDDRWIRVNGRRLQEGDLIDGQVEIIEIQPQQLILKFRGEKFRLNALTDW